MTDQELLDRIADITESRYAHQAFADRGPRAAGLAEMLRSLRCAGKCSELLIPLHAERISRGM